MNSLPTCVFKKFTKISRWLANVPLHALFWLEQFINQTWELYLHKKHKNMA
jgi:hypothetical protein